MLLQPKCTRHMYTAWSDYQCRRWCSHRRLLMPSSRKSSRLSSPEGIRSATQVDQTINTFSPYNHPSSYLPGKKLEYKRCIELLTWISANSIRTTTAPNRKGPRKLKSWPLFAAQNVYRVRLTTTTAVKITDSRITFPAANTNHIHFRSQQIIIDK